MYLLLPLNVMLQSYTYKIFQILHKTYKIYILPIIYNVFLGPLAIADLLTWPVWPCFCWCLACWLALRWHLTLIGVLKDARCRKCGLKDVWVRCACEYKTKGTEPSILRCCENIREVETFCELLPGSGAQKAKESRCGGSWLLKVLHLRLNNNN